MAMDQQMDDQAAYAERPDELLRAGYPIGASVCQNNGDRVRLHRGLAVDAVGRPLQLEQLRRRGLGAGDTKFNYADFGTRPEGQGTRRGLTTTRRRSALPTSRGAGFSGADGGGHAKWIPAIRRGWTPCGTRSRGRRTWRRVAPGGFQKGPRASRRESGVAANTATSTTAAPASTIVTARKPLATTASIQGNTFASVQHQHRESARRLSNAARGVASERRHRVLKEGELGYNIATGTWDRNPRRRGRGGRTDAQHAAQVAAANNANARAAATRTTSAITRARAMSSTRIRTGKHTILDREANRGLGAAQNYGNQVMNAYLNMGD